MSLNGIYGQTHSPTTHFAGLLVTDNSTDDGIYSDWYHRKTTTDSDGRSSFLFNDGTYRSALAYDDTDGWRFILFDDVHGTTAVYASNIHGCLRIYIQFYVMTKRTSMQ